MLVKVNVIKLKGILKENKITYAKFSENSEIEINRFRAMMRGAIQPKLHELDTIVKSISLNREDICIWSDGKYCYGPKK